jgi:hypothetical protein
MFRKLLAVALAIGSQACYASDGAAAPVLELPFVPLSDEEVRGIIAKFDALMEETGLRAYLGRAAGRREQYGLEHSCELVAPGSTHPVQFPIDILLADFSSPTGIKFSDAPFYMAGHVQDELIVCSRLSLLATGLFTRKWNDWRIIIYNMCQNISRVSSACGPLTKKIASDTSRFDGIIDGVRDAIRLLDESRIPTEQIVSTLGQWLPLVDAADRHLSFLMDRLSGCISDEPRRQQDAAGHGATDESPSPVGTTAGRHLEFLVNLLLRYI